MSLSEKITKWLVFSVLLALLPIGFNYLSLSTRGLPSSRESLLGGGELLLVASSIAAAAVGELLGSGKAWLIAKLIAGGGCILVLGLTSLYFADIASAGTAENLDTAVIAWNSQLFFLFAVVAGGGCMALSGIE